MDVAIPSDIESVLIVKADKIYADTLREVVTTTFGHAQVRLAGSVAEATTLLRQQPVDLLLTGVESAITGNVLDFLATCLGKPRLARRVLVLITHGEFRLLSALRSLPVHGVFDSANDEPRNFIPALKDVAAGTRYWSPITLERIDRQMSYRDSLFRILTPFEQLVLSIVGDGSDDATAARELKLSPATISTVRRHLHRKLGVQHRGELVRVAALNGFVRFTPAGVVRPGFGILTATYRARRRIPTDPSEPELAPAG